MTRTATLQVNQLGSWRNAIAVDIHAIDEAAMLRAADGLARAIDPKGTLKLRLVDSEQQPPAVLMTWDMHRGWKPWRDQP